MLLTPFNSLSLNELERGNNGIKQLSHRPSLFYSPPFYSPSLTELERGNNGKKIIRIAPLFFTKRGEGGELEFA